MEIEESKMQRSYKSVALYQIEQSMLHPRNPNPYSAWNGFGFVYYFESYEATLCRNVARKMPESKPRGPKKKKKKQD